MPQWSVYANGQKIGDVKAENFQSALCRGKWLCTDKRIATEDIKVKINRWQKDAKK